MNLYTLKKSGTSDFRDRGSKFFGTSLPLNNLHELKNQIESFQVEHPTATHICYAYRIFINDRIDEFSTDDGEPRGSSGAPILNVLKRNEIINAVIFVVRYYGGSKLGIPGLINAYGTAADESISDGALKVWVPTVRIEIVSEYTQQRILDQVAANTKSKLESQEFGTDIVSIFSMHPDEYPEFCNLLQELSSGKLKAEKIQEQLNP